MTKPQYSSRFCAFSEILAKKKGSSKTAFFGAAGLIGIVFSPAFDLPVTFCILFFGGIPTGHIGAEGNVHGLVGAVAVGEDDELGVGGNIIVVVDAAVAVVALLVHAEAGPCRQLAVRTVDVDINGAPALVVGELNSLGLGGNGIGIRDSGSDRDLL